MIIPLFETNQILSFSNHLPIWDPDISRFWHLLVVLRGWATEIFGAPHLSHWIQETDGFWFLMILNSWWSNWSNWSNIQKEISFHPMYAERRTLGISRMLMATFISCLSWSTHWWHHGMLRGTLTWTLITSSKVMPSLSSVPPWRPMIQQGTQPLRSWDDNMITGTCDNHHSTNSTNKRRGFRIRGNFRDGISAKFSRFFLLTQAVTPWSTSGRFTHQQPRAPNPSCCAYLLHTFHLPAVPENDQLRYLSQTAIIENWMGEWVFQAIPKTSVKLGEWSRICVGWNFWTPQPPITGLVWYKSYKVQRT